MKFSTHSLEPKKGHILSGKKAFKGGGGLIGDSSLYVTFFGINYGFDIWLK